MQDTWALIKLQQDLRSLHKTPQWWCAGLALIWAYLLKYDGAWEETGPDRFKAGELFRPAFFFFFLERGRKEMSPFSLIPCFAADWPGNHSHWEKGKTEILCSFVFLFPVVTAGNQTTKREYYALKWIQIAHLFCSKTKVCSAVSLEKQYINGWEWRIFLPKVCDNFALN